MNKSTLLLSLPIFFLSACTMNEGDPQVTLCQLLAANINQSEKVEWAQADKKQLADKSMQVSIHSAGTSAVKIEGVCVYLSDADDAGKDYDVNILDGYQNIPSRISINNKPIATNTLYIAIQKVTGQSVKDTLKKVQ